jgi:hypothetical protein
MSKQEDRYTVWGRYDDPKGFPDIELPGWAALLNDGSSESAFMDSLAEARVAAAQLVMCHGCEAAIYCNGRLVEVLGSVGMR